MKYFDNNEDFEKNMMLIKEILEEKGFVMESDHPYAYCMQYDKAFDDISEWLSKNDYEGDLDTMGAFERVAVYGLYDKSKVSFKKMQNDLLSEARRQNSL